MPGPRRTTPDASNPDFLRALTERIMQTLNQPEPRAPQPPQPQALDPVSAYAVARNPQTLDYFSDMANAPAANQYKAAQSAFEEAMQGRRNALTAGVSLANTQTRATASGNRPLRLIPRNVVRNGVNVGITEIFDPVTGEKLGESEAGEMAYAPTIDPGIDPATGRPTMMRYPKNIGGTAFPVQDAGGRNVGAVPPAGIQNDYMQNAAFVQSSQALKAAWSRFKQKTSGATLLGRIAGQEAGESKYGTVIAPAYAEFESTVKATLNAYIRSVTGLSFPEAAYQRHRSELPIATDSDEQAALKIDNVLRATLAEMGYQGSMYPGLGAGGPVGGAPGARTGPTADEILQRALDAARSKRTMGNP